MRENNLKTIENFLENKEKKIDVKDEPFDKLMFFYRAALKQVETQMNIIKEEFEIMYNYDLIDHITTRNLIEKVNDIAGIRLVCTLKDDIFFIRDLIRQIPNIRIVKEKDYVTNPKESGYASYHMIIEVPVKLTQKTIYVKCEIQIRTLAMDFWASFEHKVKYKSDYKINKKASRELVNFAKVINKFDEKHLTVYNNNYKI